MKDISDNQVKVSIILLVITIILTSLGGCYITQQTAREAIKNGYCQEQRGTEWYWVKCK